MKNYIRGVFSFFFKLSEIKITDIVGKCLVRSLRDLFISAWIFPSKIIFHAIFVMRFLRKINAVKEMVECRCGKGRNFAEIIIKKSGYVFQD